MTAIQNLVDGVLRDFAVVYVNFGGELCHFLRACCNFNYSIFNGNIVNAPIYIRHIGWSAQVDFCLVGKPFGGVFMERKGWG